MILLGDYLAHLLKEINYARAKADFESVEIAKLYSGNELLKKFSVPRFRLPNVELNVPVVVSGSELQKTLTAETIDADAFSKETRTIISDKIAQTFKVDLNRYQKASLTKRISSIIEEQTQKNNDIDIDNLISSISTGVSREIVSDYSNLKFQELDRVIRKELSTYIEKNIDSPLERLKNISIQPESHAIKEMGDTDKVLNIKLTISEEGMEWIEIESNDPDGKTIKKNILSPE